MLAFYPEFEADTEQEQEFTFLLDMSNSMKGQASRDAKKVFTKFKMLYTFASS